MRPVESLARPIALSLLLAGCGAGSSSGDGGPPNVVLFSIDSLRADHLGCYGYERDTSPAIDALAAEGALFVSTSSSTSWTLPAHATMFTGLPSSIHGCSRRQPKLSPGRHTLAEDLKRAGYRTAGFWSGPYLHPVFGLDQGFDEYVSCAGFEMYEGGTMRMAETRQRSHEDTTSPRILERVSAWLRAAGTEPFFLFIHMWDVHYDYIAPPPYDTRFDPDYRGDFDGRIVHGTLGNLSPRDLEHLHALYDAEIAWTDDHIGKILAIVDELDLRERTAVLLTADHGEEFFEHGQFGHRKTLFEEAIAVPLVLRYPKSISPGLRVSTPVSVADIAPTILELAGVAPRPGLHGRSLLPVLGGGGDETLVLSELIFGQTDYFIYSVRAGDTKLLVSSKTNQPVGMWDLGTDPEERTNLIGDEQARARADPLLQRARARLLELARLNEALEEVESGELPAEIEESLRDLGYIGGDE